MVNRILPGIDSDGMGNTWVADASTDPYLHHLQEIQARYLGEIERRFLPAADSALAVVRQGDGRYPRLRELANCLFGDRDPGELFFTGQPQSVSEEGDDFVLQLPLPQVELDKVRLTKRGDELFVSIGNFKRELLLPRCWRNGKPVAPPSPTVCSRFVSAGRRRDGLNG